MAIHWKATGHEETWEKSPLTENELVKQQEALGCKWFDRAGTIYEAKEVMKRWAQSYPRHEVKFIQDKSGWFQLFYKEKTHVSESTIRESMLSELDESIFSDIETLKLKLKEFIRDEEEAKNEYDPWVKFANDLARKTGVKGFLNIADQIAGIREQEKQHKFKFESDLRYIESIEPGLKRECAEKSANEITSSMREYIRGATPLGPVIFRGGGGEQSPSRGELYRARDRTYFVETPDGQICASMGWERV